MEINVTKIVRETTNNALQFSASRAEIGEKAGEITWSNALNHAMDKEFELSKEELADWLEFLPGYGAWDDEEIAGWSGDEATALFIQFVSGDVRSLEWRLGEQDASLEDHTEGQFRAATENEGGSLFRSDSGKWFYYVGN